MLVSFTNKVQILDFNTAEIVDDIQNKSTLFINDFERLKWLFQNL